MEHCERTEQGRLEGDSGSCESDLSLLLESKPRESLQFQGETLLATRKAHSL